MINVLVSMYWNGAITAHHLIGESVCRLNPADPGATLDRIPTALRDQLSEFIDQLRSGPMLSNYPTMPSVEQMAAAIGWLDQTRAPRDQTRVPDLFSTAR